MTARGRVAFESLVASALLAAGAGGLLSGCSSTPIPPTYTEEELKAICECGTDGGAASSSPATASTSRHRSRRPDPPL